jgi:hypothetical protein
MSEQCQGNHAPSGTTGHAGEHANHHAVDHKRHGPTPTEINSPPPPPQPGPMAGAALDAQAAMVRQAMGG